MIVRNIKYQQIMEEKEKYQNKKEQKFEKEK